jgi:hypothetical protein
LCWLLGSLSKTLTFIFLFLLFFFFPALAESDTCDALPLMYATELAPATVPDYRQKSMLLERLRASRYLYGAPPLLRQAMLQFLVGQFHVNFTLLWPDVQRTAAVWAEAWPEEFWAVLQAKIQTVSDAASRISQQLRGDVATHLAAHREVKSADGLRPLLEALQSLPSLSDLCESYYDRLLRARLRPQPTEVRELGASAGDAGQLFARTLEGTASHLQTRVDVMKVHSLLLQLMAKMPNFCERYNRCVDVFKPREVNTRASSSQYFWACFVMRAPRASKFDPIYPSFSQRLCHHVSDTCALGLFHRF